MQCKEIVARTEHSGTDDCSLTAVVLLQGGILMKDQFLVGGCSGWQEKLLYLQWPAAAVAAAAVGSWTVADWLDQSWGN